MPLGIRPMARPTVCFRCSSMGPGACGLDMIVFVAESLAACYGWIVTEEMIESTYECPACAAAVKVVVAEEARLATCPHCAAEFLVPAADGSTELPEDRQSREAAEREREVRHEAELS